MIRNNGRGVKKTMRAVVVCGILWYTAVRFGGIAMTVFTVSELPSPVPGVVRYTHHSKCFPITSTNDRHAPVQVRVIHLRGCLSLLLPIAHTVLPAIGVLCYRKEHIPCARQQALLAIVGTATVRQHIIAPRYRRYRNRAPVSNCAVLS